MHRHFQREPTLVVEREQRRVRCQLPCTLAAEGDVRGIGVMPLQVRQRFVERLPRCTGLVHDRQHGPQRGDRILPRHGRVVRLRQRRHAIVHLAPPDAATDAPRELGQHAEPATILDAARHDRHPQAQVAIRIG